MVVGLKRSSYRLRRLAFPVAAVMAALVIGVTAPSAIGSRLPAAPTQPPPTPTTTNATNSGELTIRMAPVNDILIDPVAPLTLHTEIDNPTSSKLDSAILKISRATESITTTAELGSWVKGENEATVIVDLPIAISTGKVATDINLDPASLEATEIPIVALRAELVVNNEIVGATSNAYAVRNTQFNNQVGLALAYPLTAPTSSDGLISAEQLATLTSPDGLLSRQLDAVAGRQIAVGIDPQIIASIRVLGDSAPASATAWLQRLATITNTTFPLTYADADLAAQAQSGLSEPLSSDSFSDVIDPKNFSPAATEPTDLVMPNTTPGVAPSTTPGAVELPTTQNILSWAYSRSDIAWPMDGTIHSSDFAFLAKAGLTTSILGPDDAQVTDDLVNASASGPNGSLAIPDQRITKLLRVAAQTDSNTEWRQATGAIAAELFLGSQQDSALTLLATFARETVQPAPRLTATVDAITSLPWARSATLADAIGSAPTARTFIDHGEDESRLNTVKNLVETEKEIEQFATVIADQAALTAQRRRQLLALLGVGWLIDAQKWQSAANQWLTTQSTTLNSVAVVQSSTINVISSETGVPTTIQNGLKDPITVRVEVAPSNGRLIVEKQLEVTVEPESRRTVIVPVAAGVGNGEVTLAVLLRSPTGDQIGRPVYFDVNVRADWEGLGAAILSGAVVLVFGVGIWRNIRRRKRRLDQGVSITTAETAPGDDQKVPSDGASVANGTPGNDGLTNDRQATS